VLAIGGDHVVLGRERPHHAGGDREPRANI
jgi:hypothetical protein